MDELARRAGTLGRLTSQPGQSECKLAPAGKFVNVTGASATRSCAPGKSSQMASSNCTDCGIGETSDGGASSCIACGAGESSNSTGARQCESCPPGTYKPAGKGPCLDCPAATYTDQPGQSECKLAEPGTYVSEPGSSEATNCSARAWTKISHWAGPWRLGRIDAAAAT